MIDTTRTDGWCDRAQIGFAGTLLHAIGSSCYPGTQVQRFNFGPEVVQIATELVRCATFDVAWDLNSLAATATHIRTAGTPAESWALMRLARHVTDLIVVQKGYRCYWGGGSPGRPRPMVSPWPGFWARLRAYWPAPEAAWVTSPGEPPPYPPMGVLVAPWRLVEARQRSMPEASMSYDTLDAFRALVQIGRVRQGCDVVSAAYRAVGSDPSTWAF